MICFLFLKPECGKGIFGGILALDLCFLVPRSRRLLTARAHARAWCRSPAGIARQATMQRTPSPSPPTPFFQCPEQQSSFGHPGEVGGSHFACCQRPESCLPRFGLILTYFGTLIVRGSFWLSFWLIWTCVVGLGSGNCLCHRRSQPSGI